MSSCFFIFSTVTNHFFFLQLFIFSFISSFLSNSSSPILSLQKSTTSPSFLHFSHMTPKLKSPSFSKTLSKTLFKTHGSKDFLHRLRRYLQFHLLDWCYKIERVSSTTLQAKGTSIKQCMARIGKFLKLFLIFKFCSDLQF